MIIYFLILRRHRSIPYVGTVAPLLLTPVFMGGIMLGCQAIERDEPLRVAHLFEGFQGAHFVPLMIIGAVNIALVLCIVAIVAAGVFGGIKVADMLTPGDPVEAFDRDTERDDRDDGSSACSSSSSSWRYSRCSTGSRRRWLRCAARPRWRR